MVGLCLSIEASGIWHLRTPGTIPLDQRDFYISPNVAWGTNQIDSGDAVGICLPGK